MIDRYLLRYFLAVIDHGNFSRAALHCRVSQPTLSVGIAKLEALLARPLFNRTNRRVELTAAGARFAIHARRIEAEFAEAEFAVSDDAPSRLIRLGIISTLPSGWVESAIIAAGAADTGERLEIVEGRSRDLHAALERGRIDVVLGPVADEARDADILFEENYALALPATHPLAAHATVKAESLAGETMIVRRHCEALPEISRHFTARGIRPFMAARTANDDRAIAYVRAGLGITVMPRCFASPGIAMPALAGFCLTRRIGFFMHPDSRGRVRDSVTVERLGAGICERQSALS